MILYNHTQTPEWAIHIIYIQRNFSKDQEGEEYITPKPPKELLHNYNIKHNNITIDIEKVQ